MNHPGQDELNAQMFGDTTRDELIELILDALHDVHDMDVTFIDYANSAADALIAAGYVRDGQVCPFGDDCDLTVAYMAGAASRQPDNPAVEALVKAAWAEAEKAMRKFPQPNYVISKVAEEAGEVVKAAIHCAEGRESPEAVVSEITQAMAMLIRLYLEGDQVHGLPALATLKETEHE